MEDINKFIEGLNTDVHPSIQPPNTVRKMVNFAPLTRDGNLYSVTNEDGTLLLDQVTFPDGFQVMGHSVLNSEIIVILVNQSGHSQVGYIIEDDSPDATYGFYHPVGPIDSSGNVLENNSELGFTLAHPVDCVSRKLINGHRILYFTDNNVPFGQFDLDNPPVEGTVADTVKLTFNQNIVNINISEIRENVSSTIRPGIVQFITRYVTQSGGVTNFGIPSNPLPIVPENRSVGADGYHGAFYEDQIVNKNVILEFTNVDTQYTELEVVAIYYEGSQSVFKSSIVGQIPITSDVVEFTYTGPDTEAEIELTREELRKLSISYTKAKCIEQKDNTLFLSNLSSSRQDNDSLLQQIANNVEVSYRVQEVQYSGRGDNQQNTNIAFLPLHSPYIAGVNDLILPMSENVDVSTSEIEASYLLTSPGMVAMADVEITDYTLILDGDTFEIDTSTGGPLTQPTVTFTARTTPTLADEFQIGATNTETALNLSDAINNSVNVVDYYSILVNNAAVLYWSTIDVNANGVSINLSGSGVTSNNFTGASVSPMTSVPLSATATLNEITLTFAVPVSTSDTLQVIGDISNEALDEIYSTGTNSNLPILSAQPDDAGVNTSTGFTDYTNEELTVTSKGYRRGEVYSLGFVLLFKDGTTSFVYHIPAEKDYINEAAFVGGQNKFEPTGGWPAFSTNPTSTDRLGTYVSTNQYPLNQNYPGDQTGDDNSNAGPGVTARNIRHHYIPELANEPHFREQNGLTFIRLINLEFEFTQAIPQSILSDVADIIFVRERRNTNQNKSIFSQGLVNRTVIMADDFDNNGIVQGETITGGTNYVDVRSGYYATEMPYFNNSVGLDFTGDVFDKGGSKTNSGCVYPDFTNAGYSGTYNNGRKLSSDIIENHLFYHSPETDLLTGFRFNAENIITADLKPELLLNGTYKRVNFKGDEWEYDSPGTKGIDYQIRYMYADYFGNYTGYENTLSAATVQIEKARYASGSQDRLNALDTDEPGIKTSTRWTQGGLELITNNSLTNNGSSSFRFQNQARIRNVPGTGCISNCEGKYYGTSNVFEGGSDAEDGTLLRYLYNLRLNNLTQYGQITIGEFIPISRQSPFTGVSFKTTYTGVFGGDTFITKYAFNTGNLLSYFPYKRDGDSAINRPSKTLSHGERGYAQIDGIEKGGSTSGGPGRAHGWDLRSTTFYFVESEINTHYRHRPEDELKQDYYPNELDLSRLLNNYFPYLENINAYNTQYSYENNIKVFFTKGSTQSVISSFENRTIYSETAAEDDTLDSYRSFLQNNFYDLPSDTGPIWDTFIEFNELFMHTPKSLWRTFAEPAATLSGGNISDVVLGTGSLFARPSVEMRTTTGGYAGTISQYGGVPSQIGYVFPDVLQGKIFGLLVGKGGPYLKELSAEGIQTDMHIEIPIELIKFNNSFNMTNVTTQNAHLIDNPFQGIGFIGGYDFKLKRVWIIKHKKYDDLGVIDEGFALSYSTVTNKWFSYHDYFPNKIIPYDNRTLFIRNINENTPITADVWDMNRGEKCNFFGTIYDSNLHYVSSQYPKTKTFDNLVIHSDSKDITTGIKVRDDNFSTLQVYNDRMNTSLYTFVHGNTFLPTKTTGEVFIKFRNDEYRVALPRDAVIDNAGDIFEPSNLDQTSQSAERIKGDYAHFVFTYDNTQGLEFLLREISTIFRANIR